MVLAEELRDEFRLTPGTDTHRRPEDDIERASHG